MESLVSTQWLADALGSPGLVVLDASAHLPAAGRDAAGEFAAAHIPGARFLDLKTLTDPDNPVPAAPPTRAQFAARMAALGVTGQQRVVLYDDSAMRTAARAWFLLRLFGVEAAVLDGGMARWRAEGRPTQHGAVEVEASPFASRGGTGTIRFKTEMLANIDSRAEQVVDARDAPRFRGDEPDIRPNMPSGHIPNSRNLPFGEVLNADGTFKDEAGIRAAFAGAGIDLDRPVVATCGSGVTASVLLFALHLIGKDAALYDGSWSDWGADPAMPVATGPAA
ncbi:sulfurtransferase [Erythrobacter arachoides]|uniref:Sulfurtransferase n=1 Tax=Aurantiacibacter arachoides TaxID=1850444 RepID=A0A844ZZ39_9SPHN|nr:sulfurtransferase [Aurantiacibacter arachoides]MXO92510.1 sulfurtransferase [Aurantiacibacter arachoides]GGD56599.1 thiosulfate sulfurtransferase [Aurantiacibacter arachoides]